jgi:mono/diheme cytochrome c family protein
MSAPGTPKSRGINPVALTQADRGEQHDVVQIHAAILREKPDPREGFEPVNLWLVVLIAGLLFWGGSYLSHYSGRFEADEFQEVPRGKAVGGGGPVDPTAAVKQAGMLAFNNVCAACHNDDGMGKPGTAPPLAGSDWVNAENGNRIIRIALHGLQGAIKVNASNEFNLPSAQMPPQGSVFDDKTIAAVLTYIRSAWGNKAGEIKPEQVKAIRDQEKAHESAIWTVDDLLKIPLGSGAPPAELSLDQLKAKLKALPPEQLAQLMKDIGK